MPAHHKINYVEFSAHDIPASKAFFAKVFGWTFEDFGSEYTAFANAGIEGGFFANNAYSRTEHGSALIVLYSDDLEKSYADIVAAGGQHCETNLCVSGWPPVPFLRTIWQ